MGGQSPERPPTLRIPIVPRPPTHRPMILHLLRHGANDALKEHRLAGRDTALSLNAEGRAQAERLAGKLADTSLSAILSSPLPRCQQTARPLAKLKGLQIETRDELIELDFGDWTGKRIAEIEGDERWTRFNAFRSGTGVPNGETIAEARARMLRLALELRERFPEGEVALCSHGDPLRALLLQFLGMPDDAIHRIELGPCSWTSLELGPWGAKLLRLEAI